MIATSFLGALSTRPLQTLEIKCLPYNNRQPTFSPEALLTLNQNPWESKFEFLFSFFHLFLMSCFLIHQSANVAVGRLDHGVEIVGSPPVHFSTLYPGQQGLDGFWELCVIFQFLSNNAALMVGVMDDRRWGGWAEALLFQPPAMALLSCQHPLLTFPLIQIIPSLSKIYMQAPSILLVSAGAQPDAIAWQWWQQCSDKTGDSPWAPATHQCPSHSYRARKLLIRRVSCTVSDAGKGDIVRGSAAICLCFAHARQDLTWIVPLLNTSRYWVSSSNCLTSHNLSGCGTMPSCSHGEGRTALGSSTFSNSRSWG